ncbi:MAG: glycosyltransferase family 4 protein [Endomicrobiales bacterium]|nr:glycosyltransferase family 4 protein [Endomicrobiales bacterium]
MTKKTIAYYSDCPFFAGCENMLSYFFASQDIKSSFNILFFYRHSTEYNDGLMKKAFFKDVTYIPLNIWDFETINEKINHSKLKPLFFPIKVILKYVFFIRNLLVIWHNLSNRKIEILHVNNGGYPAAYSCLAAILAAKFAGISKTLMVVNNIAFGYKFASRKFDYLIDKLIAINTNLFITGSQNALDALSDMLKLPKKKLMSIHNGIQTKKPDVSRFDYLKQKGINTNNRPIFGIVALLIERKGHKHLLNAQKMLVERMGNRKAPLLLIEGTGPLEAELKNLSDSLGLCDDVIFTKGEENIFNFINVLDVFVLSSICNEDFPFVILEAMSIGKAVIATDVGGVKEQIINNETGLIVEPANSVALSLAMQELASNHEKVTSFGVAGKNRFYKHFDYKIATNKYLAVYNKMLNKISN